MSEPEADSGQHRNTAALLGFVAAAIAAVTIVVTLLFEYFGAPGANAISVVSVEVVVSAFVIPVLSLAGLVLGVIGIRRSARLGLRRLATWAVVVSSICLLLALVVIGGGLLLVALTGAD